MPKQPNTPQIITPLPRSLKEAWDKECVRLKYSVEGITFPGDVLKGLCAGLLAEPDEAKRDEIVKKNRQTYLANWADTDDDDESAEEPTVRPLQPRGPTAPGSDDIAGRSRNRITGKMRLPKRG